MSCPNKRGVLIRSDFVDNLMEIKAKHSLVEENLIGLMKENGELKKEIQLLTKTADEKEKLIGQFTKVKPVIEEMYRHFDETDPKMLIQQIKEANEGSTYMLEAVENVKREMEDVKRACEAEKDLLQQEVYQCKNKINGLIEEINDVREAKDSEIVQLKADVASYLEYKEDNINLNRMLFTLFNCLYDRLNLEKDLKFGDDFKPTEKDFKPRLFDNQEVKQYIRMMLLNSHESTSSKVLREVIAYANMILRKHFNNAHMDGRFKPVQTFIRINDKLDSLSFQNEKFKSQKKHYTGIIDGLQREIKKLEQTIKTKNGAIKLLEIKNNKKAFDNMNRKSPQKDKKVLAERTRKAKAELFITEDKKISKSSRADRPQSGFVLRKQFNDKIVARQLKERSKKPQPRIYKENNKLAFTGYFNLPSKDYPPEVENLVRQTQKLHTMSDRLHKNKDETVVSKFKRKIESATKRMDNVKEAVDYNKIDLRVEGIKMEY